MTSFYERLQLIRLRPGMYICDVNIYHLQSFIYGYLIALDDNDVSPDGIPDFGAFNEFVRAKYQYFESTAGWANMIVGMVLGYEAKNIHWEDVLVQNVTFEQHKQAIEMFFELLDEFQQMND